MWDEVVFAYSDVTHKHVMHLNGPEVEAACQFVEKTGRRAAIGVIDQAEAILQEQAGTIIRAA